ncbi:hypothetical protein PXH69_24185 [Rhodococcus qingshengii]|uniref:Head-to-tail adaptor n=1 Tax=Rhodococcus qingshengii TaxID=334542 RepID=A0AAW6LS45_RHOSG|nr:hypothetical protein [Rhodococcus qingshengii]MDE8648082.1 hypothetical protein [Rhodococcus qingshengii]
MGIFADSTDVAARFEGNISPEQMTWIDVKIVDAEALLATYIPRLSSPETATAKDYENARRVVCDAVLRVFRNPAGHYQEEAGPWKVTRAASVASGALFFSPDELASFRQVRRKRIGMLGIAPPRYNGEDVG